MTRRSNRGRIRLLFARCIDTYRNARGIAEGFGERVLRSHSALPRFCPTLEQLESINAPNQFIGPFGNLTDLIPETGLCADATTLLPTFAGTAEAAVSTEATAVEVGADVYLPATAFSGDIRDGTSDRADQTPDAPPSTVEDPSQSEQPDVSVIFSVQDLFAFPVQEADGGLSNVSAGQASDLGSTSFARQTDIGGESNLGGTGSINPVGSAPVSIAPVGPNLNTEHDRMASGHPVSESILSALLSPSNQATDDATSIQASSLDNGKAEHLIAPAAATPANARSAQEAAIASNYGKLPISFEANEGQADPEVRFQANGPGYRVSVTPTSASLTLASPSLGSPNTMHEQGGLRGVASEPGGLQEHLTVDFLGANPNATVTGVGLLPGHSNYLIGDNRADWHTDIPNYSKVQVVNLYPGVDVVYYGNSHGQLEYDLIVAPGADPTTVHMQYRGASQMSLDSSGNLLLDTPAGQVVEKAPTIYQIEQGATKTITGQFVLHGSNDASFAVGTYNRSEALIIDPSVSYDAYLGAMPGPSDNAVAADSSGNAYVVGTTTDYRVCVAKVNADGTSLDYVTYLAGSRTQYGSGVAADSSGNAYVSGTTTSTAYWSAGDFPVTTGAYQTSSDQADAGFVAKLNSTGDALIFSTLLSGSGGTYDGGVLWGVKIDGSGHAFVTGDDQSGTFPVTTGAYQTSLQTGAVKAGVVTKLSSDGSSLVYSTYIGAVDVDVDLLAIALDGSGNAYVTGQGQDQDHLETEYEFQALAVKVNSTGTGVGYYSIVTYQNSGSSIAVDSSGNAYITRSDAITKVNSSGSNVWTFTDAYGPVAVDSSGDAYVTGNYLTGVALVVEISSDGTGVVFAIDGDDAPNGNGNAIFRASSGDIYVAGGVAGTPDRGGTDLDTTNDYPTTNTFITKIA